MGCIVHAQTVKVEQDAYISADGEGFKSGSGPGKGSGMVGGGCGGGGHGGCGADSCGASQNVYGDETQPRELGSGGGCPGNGHGGGSIGLTVKGVVSCDGAIRACGISGQQTGGGAGGSILVSASAFSGSGTFVASGGAGCCIDGTSNGYGGGGGRIVLHGDVAGFGGTVFASGGTANNNGQPGTVQIGP
jgi:hypothetical protein